MMGTVISHYRILEELGQGGMGVVYKAQDTKLNRTVALKFLPPELTRDPAAKERFVHEARTASSLQHKNICVVHDIDETEDAQMFISMEYLDGETLKKRIEAGPLSVNDAVTIASQIAHGLAHAHSRGIVHRDIKPGNVIITRDHTVKILDFGLAKISGVTDLTKAGVTLGTAAYMSPEQIRGERVDLRTDIWSLGVVLYEMVTGDRPFRGEYDQGVMYAIIHEKHRPASAVRPDVPAALGEIINKCLEKLPVDRIPDAAAFLDALPGIAHALAAPQEAASKSIAVLTFADISPEGDNKYFSDGLTDEIVAKLSRLRNIKIISRASVMHYERAGLSTKQIAAELGVQYVLEGSVRKHGTNLRITTHLTAADQDAYLWAETYKGTMDEIFDIQENVASRIMKALRMRVTPDEKRTLRRRATNDTEAYQLYFKGRFFWNKRSKEGLRAAIQYFEKAIEKDPRFALAWAGIADSYNLLSEYADTLRPEMYPHAMSAIQKALEFDGRLAEAHASLASLVMLNEWDWPRAEREFKLAISLNPNYATAHHWYAEWFSLQGRSKEAISEMVRAVELDPLSPAILKDYGMILYYARDYNGAIEWAKKSHELDPTFASVHRLLSLAYLGKEMSAEAMAENELWNERGGKGVEALVARAQCYAAAGKRDEASTLLERVKAEEHSDGNVLRGIALVYAALDEIDEAFTWLGKALEKRAVSLCNLKVDPKVDRLRGDSRFALLLNAVGLGR